MKKEVNLLVESDTTPWKDVELEGKLVVIKDKYFTDDYRDAKYQLVIAVGGFGCNPIASGNAIFVKECHNDNPETYRIERCNNDILGIATEDAITEWKEIYGEFNEEVLKMINGEPNREVRKTIKIVDEIPKTREERFCELDTEIENWTVDEQNFALWRLLRVYADRLEIPEQCNTVEDYRKEKVNHGLWVDCNELIDMLNFELWR
jgi:hypothetical protein